MGWFRLFRTRGRAAADPPPPREAAARPVTEGTFEMPEAQPSRSFDLPEPPPAAGFAEAPLRGLDGVPGLVVPVSNPDPSRLAEANLLARLLASVLPGDGRREAAAALKRFGSLAGVLAAPEAELRSLPGLGTHSVAAVKLVHEAAIRLARATLSQQPVLDSRERLYGYLASVLAHERIEQFRILFLDESGMLRADEVQGTGTVNHTPVYPREVVRRALELGASSVVLVHNHPSGDPTPSRDDVEMTAAVQEAARALAIAVRDHIVVGAGRWVSLSEAGLM